MSGEKEIVVWQQLAQGDTEHFPPLVESGLDDATEQLRFFLSQIM